MTSEKSSWSGLTADEKADVFATLRDRLAHLRDLQRTAETRVEEMRAKQKSGLYDRIQIMAKAARVLVAKAEACEAAIKKLEDLG